MALYWSTGFRQFIAEYGDYRRALMNGALKIFTGTAPASADLGFTGTRLVTITTSSGAHTLEVISTGSVELTGGGSGSVDSIKVGMNAAKTEGGIEILGAVITFSVDLPTTAALVANQINKFNPLGIYAVSDGTATPLITLTAPYGVGLVTWTVKSASTTVTTTDADFSGGTAPVNGLQYDLTSGGILPKSGVWSGSVAASGTAGYFRIYAATHIESSATASTSYIRLQGTCGAAGSGADYEMDSTALTSGTTHTIDVFNLILPAA